MRIATTCQSRRDWIVLGRKAGVISSRIVLLGVMSDTALCAPILYDTVTK